MSRSLPWLLTMAWRDSRRSRRRLLLFASPLVLGVAALVAIQSLRDNIQDSIDQQSKALLGADLLLSSRRPFTEEASRLLDEIGGQRLEEISFTTMAYSPETDAARLVHLRGVSPGFPHFSRLEIDPPSAWDPFLQPQTHVLEPSLAEQLNLQPGDTLRVGNLESTNAGLLLSSPPRSSYFAAFSPQVLIPLEDIEKTGLITDRSLVFYRHYIKLPESTDVEALAETLEPRFEAARISYQTPEKRRQDIGRQLDRLYLFLGLVSLASVILGGIGIASAIHQHISRRLRSIAILRCLGATSSQAFAIYLLQAGVLGLLGCLGGIAVGVAIQATLPALISQATPLDVTFRVSPPAILMASALSLLICASFALLPLLKIRRVSPLAAIRSVLLHKTTGSRFRDPWTLGILTVLFLAIFGFTLWNQGWHLRTFGTAAGLVAVFLLLLGAAKLAVILSRRAVRPWWPFALRQGLANLHRPHNQTLTVLVSLGLGVFLIVTLLLTQDLLLSQLRQERLADKGNFILIDVQPEQSEPVRNLLEREDIEILQSAPMVSMRIEAIRGRPVKELVEDPDEDIPGWTLRRDFRSTYRAHLEDSETLLRGQWIPRVDTYDFESPAPMSLEAGIAEDLGLDVGDTLTMDVQGLSLPMRVTSIREVDWGTLGLNFFMVFPEGIFEEALAFYVYTAYIDDPALSGHLQTELTKAFPNLSVIDLTLIVRALEDILNKVALAIRFMAAFTILTGILILIATLLSGRTERLNQMALMRTLGASNRQIWRILGSEYAALGFLAALAGIALALLAFWPMAIHLFEAPWQVHFGLLGTTFLCASMGTLLLGLLLSRGVTSAPPLETVRQQDH